MSAVLDTVDASARRGGRVARIAWMANHLWWVAALFVSVQTGLLYSDLCDDAYANGDNGPFGYGAHGDRLNLVVALLVMGLVGAVVLGIVFQHDRDERLLTVANLLIGTCGGGFALIDAVTQVDSNPYCRDSGVWPAVIIAAVILTGAVLANSRPLRGHREAEFREACP